MVMLAQGHDDRAIQITTKVLTRTPDSVFARVVRGDAYKHHARGCFHADATDDFTAALIADPSRQNVLGRGFSFVESHHFEEVLLRFHPWLRDRGPMPIRAYPMIAKHSSQNFLSFVALVLLFVGKLRRSMRRTARKRLMER